MTDDFLMSLVIHAKRDHVTQDLLVADSLSKRFNCAIITVTAKLIYFNLTIN